MPQIYPCPSNVLWKIKTSLQNVTGNCLHFNRNGKERMFPMGSHNTWTCPSRPGGKEETTCREQ